MALHDPPLGMPFVDTTIDINGKKVKVTAFVTEPWAKWLIINKRDKANRVEGGTANNIATLDADGHPQDGAKALPTGDFVGLTDSQQLANKTFAELTTTKIIASNGSGGLSEIDLADWIAGTAGRITVTDDLDGTITITIPLKTSYGIDSDTDGLKLKQQANVPDASETHVITDPADSPASADALRDDLVLNAIPEIEAALDALGVKVNAILALLLAAELMAAP